MCHELEIRGVEEKKQNNTIIPIRLLIFSDGSILDTAMISIHPTYNLFWPDNYFIVCSSGGIIISISKLQKSK